MLLNPSLYIRQFQVRKGGGIAYSAEFHDGVNVISGENSSGKSTIISLLVFALGGDISKWSEHAKLCDEVWAEVEFNGEVITIKREVSDKAGRPMDFFDGGIEEALVAPSAGWARFPYRSSGDRISFSQQIFGMLNLPELQTEVSGKITMHQLLRVHYSDQLSSIDHIFRDETFDSPDLREAIGRLLFGAYDNEVYRNQLRLRQLKADLATLKASLRNIYKVISDEHPLTLDWVRAERNVLFERLNTIGTEIEQFDVGSEPNGVSLKPLTAARANLAEAQASLSELETQLSGLELEAADSELFIDTIRQKLSAIEDAAEVSGVIDEVRYTHCPSCFAELDVSPMKGSCHLCHQPFDEKRVRGRILRQLASLRKQLTQSEELQEERIKELASLQASRSSAYDRWRVAKAKYEEAKKTPISEIENSRKNLYHQQGRLQQELEDLSRQEKLISKLDSISREKESISAEISEIEDRNDRLLSVEVDRIARGTVAIEKEIMWFLERDLPRQDTFQEARSVNISFSKDKLSVNGVDYFSASSEVYLKNSFIAGFLFAATENEFFRHLRFAIIDTIEDKGMEFERSQNFQRNLAERSRQAGARHQIIFATSMIAPELDAGEFLIGSPSTHNDRTLAIF